MSELILLTSSFPNYPDEPFLEKEFAYLTGKFDRISFVTIAPQATEQGKTTYFGEHEVFEVNFTSSGKLKTLASAFFTREFLLELRYILRRLPLSSFLSAFKVAVVSWNKANKLKKVLEKKVSDCKSNEVTIYSYWGDEGAIAASQLVDNAKVKKVVTRVHGWDVNFGVHNPPYLPFRTLIQKKCHAIFPISEYGKQQIKHVWKVPVDNVFVSRLGVDEQQRNGDNTNDCVFTIVSCSNVIPLKRVHLIAEAILGIQKPVRWVHFGDGPEMEQVEQMVKSHQEKWHDITLKGKVANEEVLEFYRKEQVDLFINASTTEGIPFSIMEAMSFGIPAFATHVGGNSEIVDESSGVLLPSDPTASAITRELDRFMNLTTEELNRYKRGAFKKWETEYSAEANFTKFVQVLTK